MSRSLRVFVMAVACVLSLCTRAAAQVALPAAVRIQVVDSAGRPLANADVSVLEGMSKVIAKGITDIAGVRTLVIPSAGEYQVVVWRLGFLRSSQFFTATAGSIALRVPLTPSAIPLPTITVTADADVNRKAYHIDADDIAASERPLFDAYDVLSKLRPEMIDARTPNTFVNKRLVERCTIQDVWVNGQRISFAPQDDRLAMKKYYHMRASMTGSGIASVPINVLSVLGSIHPEHIDEINYTDCNNFTVDKPHGRNAVFVMLKPGVKFEPGKGSYVDDVPLAIAANRIRLIGIFDDRSGEPLAGVDIVDSATGTFVVTSETGTATLAFLPDGAHTLRLRKKNYTEQRIDVVISAEERAPITLTMIAAKDD